MQNSTNIRILELLRFLYERTDENHPATVSDIIAHLNGKGIQAVRQTVYADTNALIDAGIDIVVVKSTQNQYFMGSRLFEYPELKMLTDAVASSKIISAKKSEELVQKLCRLTSTHQAEQLQKFAALSSRVKPHNEKVYYIIDNIQTAIGNHQQIRFQYYEYTQEKKKILKHDGYYYVVNPYALEWKNDHYYLIGFSLKHQKIAHFRVDRLTSIENLETCFMPIEGFDVASYESRRGLARNYITPIIGDMLLSDITPRMMDKYYRDLLSVKTVSVNNRKPTSEYLTPHTVREIHKLLRSAFNQAVRWELISRNPVLNATLPKEEHKERDIWTAETLSKAMEVCDDPILSLALNLAFSCSLRIGEMLGLTWDCIDIAPQSIENGSAYIFVNKELQRVTRGALDDLSDKGVIKKFPPCIASTHTALVLKEPKTKTSIRRVYLPKTVAYMLVERKKEIDELMDLFGDEYIDNNLVFCSSNGRPMESQVINRAFNKLIKENGLPHVVFHSLRHSSITYKLKLNGGDMKSVQGDSGHAQVKMVADVYSHIIDEDRCINAQRLEEAFYSSKTPDPVEDTEPKTADTAVTESDESDAAKILELLKNPETAALLKQLAKAL